MEETNVRNLMILIALLMPLIGFLLLRTANHAARAAGRAPLPSLKRNAWILIIAGPANLLLWWVMNGVWLGGGARNTAGLILAAVVFIAAGFGTGLFSRLRGGQPGHEGRLQSEVRSLLKGERPDEHDHE